MSRVTLARGEHAATLLIDNPQRGNALTPAMMSDARDLLSGLAGAVREGDRVGALIVRGAGERAFCAGYDLASLAEETRARPGLVIPELLELVEVLVTFPSPTIAALNGHAIGGGALLASLCDLRYARRGVRFRIPTTRIGIVYPLPGLRRLVALLGFGRAAEVLLLADDVLDEQGLAWGLYQDLTDSMSDLEDRVEGVAQDLSRRAPLAIRGTLDVLRGGAGGLEPASVAELHAGWVAQCVASDDLAEGLAAARDRREPVFKGA